jgi:quercetin dioxygenase-like cupin family protein
MIKRFLPLAAAAGILLCQTKSDVVHVNPADAKWEHEARDPAGAESVTLREDSKSGGLELLVRYPAGHVFKPHWHESNERIVMLEGRLSMRRGDTEKFLEPGGYAFLPARELQTLVCASATRCAYYVSWDGSPRSHAGPPPQ